MTTTLETRPQSNRPLSMRIITESATGLDPDRVLVFGDAVFPSGDPLDHAARSMAYALAAKTGRGADVTAVPWSSWSGQTLLSAGKAMHLANYDLVVVTLAGSVVHSRTTTTAITDAATEALVLIDQLRPHLAPTAQIVIALAHTSDQTDLEDAMRRTRGDLVVLTVDGDSETGMPRLIEVGQLLLQQQRARAGSPQWLRSAPQPFQHRYNAIHDLGITDRPIDARLDRITQQMTELFRTKGAAITFLPEGRQWSASSIWIPRGTGALQDSFCRSTVLSSGPMVIGDAWRSPHIVRRGPIRFYAGYPLETPDGTRVGAACVFDPTPRKEDTVELHLLRDFAVLARNILYRGEGLHRV